MERFFLKDFRKNLKINPKTQDNRFFKPNHSFVEEIESHNYQVYCGLIHLAKILFSVNYSIGGKYRKFIEKVNKNKEIDFKDLNSFENGILTIIFKDYNVQKRQKEWMYGVAPAILSEIITIQVSL